MKHFQDFSVDPYQILFPLGLVHAVIGTSVWILFALNLVEYPGQLHPQQMMSGFLLSFACGFIMTAIPRFTGAAPSSRLELLVATTISVWTLFAPSPATSLAILIFISIFIVRRFFDRTYSPPPHFLFLPIGLSLGISGAIILLLVQKNFVAPEYAVTGKVFLYHGTMLAFLLGIGAKLISALLGWVAPPTHRIEPLSKTADTQTFVRNKWIIPFCQAGLFLSGFAIEVTYHQSLGRALKAACANWIAFQNWRLFILPLAPGKLPLWIWISAWVLLIGLWVHSLFPGLDVHAAHLIFIGGFGLMTLLVASRVTLAHGGYSLNFESHSRIYSVSGSLILLAALSRLVAQWAPSYFRHLAYAATLWILALLLWGYFFLPKILKRSHTEN